MTFDDELLKSYEKDISRGHNRIKTIDEMIEMLSEERATRVSELAPYVIEHFDHYIETVLNPSLPGGWQMRGAKRAEDHGSGYVIHASKVRVPDEEDRCNLILDTIIRSFYKYVDEVPWVLHIIGGYANESDWDKKAPTIGEMLRGD